MNPRASLANRNARPQRRNAAIPSIGGWTAFVFLVLFIGLMIAGRERMLRDPGTFWHIVAGERMLSDLTILRTDPFSFSQSGQTWLAQQWLGECLMALVHRLGGLDLVLWGGVAMLATLFAWLAHRLHRAGLTVPLAVVLTALAVGASSYHFLLRPHLASLLFMAALVVILLDVDAGRAHPRRLLWIPTLLVAWSNTHGAALGGLASALIVFFGWLFVPHLPVVRRWMIDPAAPRWIGAAASLSAVAPLITPFGPNLPATWLSLMRSQVIPQMIIEHGRPDWTSPEGAMLGVLAAVYLALLASVARIELRVTWLLPLVWLALAMSRVRHGPLFAVTAVLAIGDMADAIRQSSRAAAFRSRWRFAWCGVGAAQGLTLQTVRAPRTAWTAAIILVALSAVLKTAGASVPVIGANWARVSDRNWPVAAVEAARRTARSIQRDADSACGGREPVRVFNDLGFGGYLIYFAPELPVYIDDRCELYGDAGLRRYREVVSHPELFVGLADYDGIDLAIVRRNTKLDRHLAERSNWQSVHTDDVAAVYRRGPVIRP
ncbi:MAG: hypothetical protein HRU71_09975 [Planctomycetia bacterium]|nr:MAG: hypothetical protein HRU71_09975 [Planctomycetia bacterium]